MVKDKIWLDLFQNGRNIKGKVFYVLKTRIIHK